MINILLLKSFQNLGSIGSVVSVKPGYAKNFLIPNKIAVLLNDKILKMFELSKAELQKTDNENYEFAKSIKNSLFADSDNGFCISIYKKTFNDGKLYGSVSTKEISIVLISEILKLDPSLKNINKFISPDKVKLLDNIKYEGEYNCSVSLYSDVLINFIIKIIKE